MNEPCPYCGRRPARNRRPYVAKKYFVHSDGTRSDFVGHKSCFFEMSYPDSELYGHARHDIPVRR